MLTIKVDCRTCPTSNSVDVHPDDYRNYLYNNQLVQNVWPDLSPSQREIIMGHSNNFYLCDVCWDSMGDE
jgi:hypothetical protein